MTNTNAYIFISYSHSDMDAALVFERKLREYKIPYFRDESNIPWGDDIPDNIHKALRQATDIVVFISPGSEKSGWVSYEVGFARGREIKIVPYLQHPKMDLPGFLTNSRALVSDKDVDSFLNGLKRRVQRRRIIKDNTNHRKLAISNNHAISEDGFFGLIKNREKKIIIELLNHRSVHVRNNAAESCVKLGISEALPILIAGIRPSGSKSYSKSLIPNAYKLIFELDGVRSIQYLSSEYKDIQGRAFERTNCITKMIVWDELWKRRRDFGERGAEVLAAAPKKLSSERIGKLFRYWSSLYFDRRGNDVSKYSTMSDSYVKYVFMHRIRNDILAEKIHERERGYVKRLKEENYKYTYFLDEGTIAYSLWVGNISINEARTIYGKIDAPFMDNVTELYSEISKEKGIIIN